MALRARNQTCLMTASGGDSIVADANESILIKDLFTAPSANQDFLTLLVGGRTVNKLRHAGASATTYTLAGGHLPYPHFKTAQIYEQSIGTIIEQLRRAGRRALGLRDFPEASDLEGFQSNPLDMSIPVAAGETFTVSRYAETGNVAVLYDIYDAADIKPEMPNGSKARKLRYLHYLTNAATAADGDCAVSTSRIWTGGPQWPLTVLSVPANNRFRIGALIGNPVAKGASAAAKGNTTHLKLVRNQEVLFDPEDRNGLPFKGDTSALSAVGYISYGSVVGPGTDLNPAPPLILSPSLDFGPGESLGIYIVIANFATGGPAAGELDFALALENEIGAA